jgi:hypothetical protein
VPRMSQPATTLHTVLLLRKSPKSTEQQVN